MITPTRSAISPLAWRAIAPTETSTLSRRTTTPSTIPEIGSAAVMPGRDLCRGAALNALSMSHSAIRLTAISE